MKKYGAVLSTLAFVFSLHCPAQRTNTASASSAKGNTILLTDNLADKGLVIKSYYVEERINKLFGGRIITYEVSKLDMVDTYDLGPNNTRTVIPIYAKPKQKLVPNAIPAKAPLENIKVPLEPAQTALTASVPKSKSINIDVINTYGKVIDKGYKTIEMLRKVADRLYFEGDLVAAAGYYTQLFELTSDLEAIYFYRYAQSLKAINETEKADALMKRFKSETLVAK